MKPGEFSLVRQKGSPFWYADHLAWDGMKGAFVRKFTSTKVRPGEDKRARKVAAGIASAAVAVAEGVMSGWSREMAWGLVNDLEQMAGLPVTTRARSWSDVSALWLEGKGKQAPRTRLKYERSCNDCSAWLGKRAKEPMEGLTGVDLQRFYDSLCARGFMQNTLAGTMGNVNAVFEMARNEGWISKNPVKLVKTSPDARNKVHKETFTVDELRRLLVAARSYYFFGEQWYTLVLLGMCTGARLGDCARMGPGHLDRSGLMWKLHFTPGKTAHKGITVDVPVVEPLLGRLKEIMAKPTSMLFCPDLAERRGLSVIFTHILRDAKIEQKITVNAVRKAGYRSKTFHSLRHTLPSWLKAAGVDKETRMKILGHTNEDTHARYTHHEMAALQKALELGLEKMAG
jgi:integrase